MSNRNEPRPPHIPGADGYGQGHVAALPMDERIAFIRKVYSIFSFSMVSWMGLTYLLVTRLSLLQIVAQRPVMYGALALWFISSMGFGFVRKMGEAASAILLLMLVTAAAALTAPMVFFYMSTAGPAIVLHAFILTSTIFGGLTAYVFYTKKDFSPLGPVLFIGTLALLAIAILNIFLPIPGSFMHFYSYIVVFMFCGWVLYDTSNIMNRYDEDQAISAAASIFIDFVVIFQHILSIMGGGRR